MRARWSMAAVHAHADAADYGFAATFTMQAPGEVAPAAACAMRSFDPEAPASLRSGSAQTSCTALVSEATVRSAISKGCAVCVKVAMARARWNAPAAPGSDEALSSCELRIDVANLLVGDASADLRLGRGAEHLPPALDNFFAGLEAAVTFGAPEIAGAGPAPAAEASHFLPPGLRTGLLPIVLRVGAAVDLPDRPATQAQLDTLCLPCSARVCVPTVPQALTEQARAPPSPWRTLTGASELPCCQSLAVRSVTFGRAHVLLAADLDLPALADAALSGDSLVVEVHDRDSEQPALALAMPAGTAPAAAAGVASAPAAGNSDALEAAHAAKALVRVLAF